MATKRRVVELDADALSWALCVLRDNEADVRRRNAMSPDWEKRYLDAAAHLQALMQKARP